LSTQLAAASDKDDVVKVVTDAYINGVHASPNGAAMRKGMHPDFRMMVLTDGKLSVVTLDDWVVRVEKAASNPSVPRYAIKSELPQVDVIGTAAKVQVEL